MPMGQIYSDLKAFNVTKINYGAVLLRRRLLWLIKEITMKSSE